VIAWFVTASRRDISLRMALGATRARVVRLVVVQAMFPVLVGLAAGVLAAFALTPLLASQLYGVGRTDPLTFAGVSALISLAALLAATLPARRAAALDPKVVLDS
jgi:ABC-type antimicrobial peptide transport system permease subunit